ncbi:hypothetical protein LH464_23830, partial [Neorhizobium sp. T786]|uniref:hypothetical protein n=1 Tax=Pseudorhizobium xiangyangii TaxID=2883104 RepID=UPI001CFF640A
RRNGQRLYGPARSTSIPRINDGGSNWFKAKKVSILKPLAEIISVSLAVSGLIIIDRMPRSTSRLQFLCKGIKSVRFGADGRPLSEQEPLAARQIF